MKFLGETSLKKLLSLIKGEIATKQEKITANGVLKGDGKGNITVADSLKNPNALTFTGAVTGTYDGSSAKTVNIPSAITVDSALSATSTNPVQNKVVKEELDKKLSNTGNNFITNGSIYLDAENGRETTIAPGSITFNEDGHGDGGAYFYLQHRDSISGLELLGSDSDQTSFITGLGTPTNDNDAANKAYVDAHALPAYSTSDNNKFLRVVNGSPSWVALTNVAEEGA